VSVSPDHWEGIARENVDRWGEQPPAVLLLALVEEVAETVDELLKTAEKGTETMVPAEAMARLAAVRDAGFECRAFLEREFEDENGEPLPREEWPTLVWDFDDVAVQEEVGDTAPLVYQLAWALDEWESNRPVATDGGWDPQPASCRDGETPDAYSHATRNAALIRDANRQLSGLGEKVHFCDVCGQECENLDDLADHDCRPNDGVELSAREIVERTGGA